MLEILTSVDSTADVNRPQERSGWSALHAAASLGFPFPLRTSSTRRPANHNNNARSESGAPPEDDFVDCARMLLQCGARVDARGHRRATPLHVACAGRPDASPACLKLLLSWGADVNARTVDGRSPLLVALDAGNWHHVRFLLEGGADGGLACEKGVSPLHAAAQWNELECVRMILAAAAVDVNARDSGGRTPLFCAAAGADNPDMDKILNAKKGDPVGYTNQHCRVVEMLLGAGADPGIRDKHGKRPSAVAKCANCKLLLDDNRKRRR